MIWESGRIQQFLYGTSEENKIIVTMKGVTIYNKALGPLSLQQAELQCHMEDIWTTTKGIPIAGRTPDILFCKERDFRE